MQPGEDEHTEETAQGVETRAGERVEESRPQGAGDLEAESSDGAESEAGLSASATGGLAPESSDETQGATASDGAAASDLAPESSDAAQGEVAVSAAPDEGEPGAAAEPLDVGASDLGVSGALAEGAGEGGAFSESAAGAGFADENAGGSEPSRSVAGEEPSATDGGQAPPPSAASGASAHKWYVVQVYSGYEQKVKLSLQDRIAQAGMHGSFGDILIPMETVQETRSGSTRVTAKTFYPGYIFVQMTMGDEAWHLVRDTPKITGFVGGRYPRPVPAPEIRSVVQQVEEGAAKPRPQVVFEHGDHVRVVDGAFANFTGTVEEVKPEKQKVRVLVSIFGRATPVELDYAQVEKTA